MEIRHLTPDSVVKINLEQIQKYTPNEPHGVLSYGGLESALMRGRQVYCYQQGADIFDIAAAIGVGLNKAHAFMNANKRTATEVVFLTLLLNGYLVRMTTEQVVDAGECIAKDLLNDAEYASILRRQSERFNIDG